MAKAIRKGDHGTYIANKMRVSAIVRTAHRDGSITVEARHVLDDAGSPQGAYLGYLYRMDANDFQPRKSAEAA